MGRILRFTPKKLNLSTGGSLKRKLGDGLVQVYHPHPEKNRMRLPPIILRFQVSFTYILKIRFGAQDDNLQYLFTVKELMVLFYKLLNKIFRC
jgi:hypothetical protein